MITNDNNWYNEWNNEWQQMTMIQRDTTNENGTVHFKKWMIVILSMTKTDTLLQGIDG